MMVGYSLRSASVSLHAVPLLNPGARLHTNAASSDTPKERKHAHALMSATELGNLIDYLCYFTFSLVHD